MSEGQVHDILLNHWALDLPPAEFPTMVKCMADGCGWTGRFPGDIAAHQAELLTAAGYGLVADAKREAWDACLETDTPWINPYRKASK